VCIRALPADSLEYLGSTADGKTALPAAAAAAGFGAAAVLGAGAGAAGAAAVAPAAH